MAKYKSFDAYLSVMPSGGSGLTEYYKNIKQQFINSQFENASDVYQVIHINSNTTTQTTLTVRINSLYRVQSKISQITDDYKRIFFQDLSYIVDLGDYFNFSNFYWLVVDTGSINSLNNSIVVRRCNSIMKYYDKNHILQQIPCIATNRIESLDEDKIILLSKNKLKVIIPYTNITKNIEVNSYSTTEPCPMRYIFNGTSWKTESIDLITNVRIDIGYIEIMLESSQIGTYDDLINNIAYNGYLPKIIIDILNNESNISLDQTLQLNVSITDNDVPVSPLPSSITYSSSSNDIATVSLSGLVTPVAEGSCTITATYNNVSDNININIVAESQNNYILVLSGNDTIKYGQTATYECSKWNNGVSVTAVFTFFIDYLGNPSNIAALTIINDNTVTIKCNQYGYSIKLIAINVEDNNLIIEKMIQLKGLI